MSWNKVEELHTHHTLAQIGTRFGKPVFAVLEKIVTLTAQGEETPGTLVDFCKKHWVLVDEEPHEVFNAITAAYKVYDK